MSEFMTLEGALKAHASAERRSSALLNAQWEFDHRLLTQALSSVGTWYPHFSLHDGSHSSTIVIQIERILGPRRIGMLSPTDLWLILEAAYWHDSGMLIVEPGARASWLGDETRSVLEEWRRSADPEQRETAELLLSGPDVEKRDWPFDVRRRLTLTVAELRRREHARVSGDYVRAPHEAGIASPRTPLVPRRLLELLARIVEGHGESLAWVMKELPQRESGLGADEAHPRLVACLLRLGDLLDLDDGRFCPVMGASFGPLPASSTAHQRKHASVRRLLVDVERIEVTATCEDFDSYELTAQWLSMLEDEIKAQAGQWADITIGPAFGALPSAGTIVAHIEGGITLPNGQRPRFMTDAQTVRELAKGTNLYKSSSAFIRELLQNAVDATLLRAYSEHAHELDKVTRRPVGDAESDPLRWLRSKLAYYPIEVQLEVMDEDAGADEDVRVRLTFEDRGTGIARSDLPQLLTIMGGSSGPAKRRLQNGMPEWMWPSGTFGIGLQSAFLVAAEVELHSMHAITLERTTIVLRRDGSVEVRGGSERRDPGTTVFITTRTRRIPPSFTPTSHAAQWMAKVDVLAMDAPPNPPLQMGAWLDALEDFSQTTVVPVRWALRRGGAMVNLGDAVHTPEAPPPLLTRTVCLEDSPSRLVGITVHAVSGDGGGSFAIGYRGAPVDRGRFAYRDFPFAATADLWWGSARELLTLDREQLSDEGRRVCHEAIWKCLARMVDDTLRDDGDSLDPSLRTAFALSAKLRGVPVDETWQEFRLAPATQTDTKSAANEGKGVTLGTLIEFGDVTLARRQNRAGYVVYANERAYSADAAIGAVLELELEQIEHCTWGTRYRRGAPRRSTTLQRALRETAWVGNRRLLVAPPAYARLAAKREAIDGWTVWYWNALGDKDLMMLSPVTGESAIGRHVRSPLGLDHLTEYVRWTSASSHDSTPEHEVAELLWRFICELTKIEGRGALSEATLAEARHALSVLASKPLPAPENIVLEPEPAPPWADSPLALLFDSDSHP